MSGTRELDGRVCVVTGAARGIGAAVAERFAAEGARLALLDRDGDGAAATAARLAAATGADARGYAVDVADEASVVGAARRVDDELGGVDLLVNNAGVGRLGPSMTLPLRAWRESLDVMATGTFLCSREFGRALRERGGGAIVNVASINGLTAFPMRLAYSAAKAAVISMTKVLAVEWADYGIRVNAVAPGMTDTELNRQGVEDGLIDHAAYMGRTPQRRFAAPEEIAESILFLASARAGFVTGHVLVPDGGWTAFGWVPWSGDPEAPELGRPAQGR